MLRDMHRTVELREHVDKIKAAGGVMTRPQGQVLWASPDFTVVMTGTVMESLRKRGMLKYTEHVPIKFRGRMPIRAEVIA